MTAFASVSCSVYEESLSRPADAGGAGGSGGAGGVGPGAQDAATDRGEPRDASVDPDGSSEPDAREAGTGGAGGATADVFSDWVSVDAPSDRGANDAPGQFDRTDGPSGDARDAAIDADGSVLTDAPQDANDDADGGGPVVGLVYNIVAKHSGKCMGLAFDLPVGLDGNPLVQWPCDGTPGQRFRLQVSGTAYSITSLGLCATIDTSDADTANQLMTSACGNLATQTFTLTPSQSAGFYVLTQQQGGKCIGVQGASTADITNVIASSCSGAPEQSWKFVPAPSD